MTLNVEEPREMNSRDERLCPRPLAWLNLKCLSLVRRDLRELVLCYTLKQERRVSFMRNNSFLYEDLLLPQSRCGGVTSAGCFSYYDR